MKTVFISCPMRGRTKEDIDKSFEKISKAAKALLGEDIKFIHTIVEEKAPYDTQKEAIWYLGGAIQILSKADVFVCVSKTYDFPGCAIEHDVAHRYGLEILVLPIEHICPDICKKWDKKSCCEENCDD